jgi:hypothetical protein
MTEILFFEILSLCFISDCRFDIETSKGIACLLFELHLVFGETFEMLASFL